MQIVREVNQDSMREQIIKDLYKIATVKWSPSSEFHDITKASLSGEREPYTYYKKDEVYYGMPFTKREKIDFQKFLTAIKQGILEVPSDFRDVLGADCTSSMIFPMLRYTYISPRYLTNDFIWDREITYPLGKIKIEGEKVNSDVLTSRFTKEDFFEAYSLLKIGDVVSSHYKNNDKWVDHTRILSGKVHVEKDGNVVDGDKSYVIVIENTASLSDTSDRNNFGGLVNDADYVVEFEPDSKLTDLKKLSDLRGKNTNFKLNRKISFTSLYVNHYIPLSFYFYGAV